jgi:hypothetical protein
MVALKDFQSKLATALAAELNSRLPQFLDETVCIFDLGCYPWHGYLELSFLTANEASQSPPPTIAEWRFYNFVPNWPRVADLGHAMQNHWAEAHDMKGVAESYLQASAAAVCSAKVSSALATYRRTSTFYTRVLNPDDLRSKNYCAAS